MQLAHTGMLKVAGIVMRMCNQGTLTFMSACRKRDSLKQQLRPGTYRSFKPCEYASYKFAAFWQQQAMQSEHTRDLQANETHQDGLPAVARVAQTAPHAKGPKNKNKFKPLEAVPPSAKPTPAAAHARSNGGVARCPAESSTSSGAAAPTVQQVNAATAPKGQRTKVKRKQVLDEKKKLKKLKRQVATLGGSDRSTDRPDMFADVQQDVVAFGEVAHAPPKATLKRRHWDDEQVRLQPGHIGCATRPCLSVAVHPLALVQLLCGTRQSCPATFSSQTCPCRRCSKRTNSGMKRRCVSI